MRVGNGICCPDRGNLHDIRARLDLWRFAFLSERLICRAGLTVSTLSEQVDTSEPLLSTNNTPTTHTRSVRL